jgi:hypothetical protein
MAARLARKKKAAEEASKEDESPSWIGKDHKVKLSYITNKADQEGTVYPCLCKRFVTEPSSRVYAGEERRAGKLVKFKRNVFVAPYELVEICIGAQKQLWYGRFVYDKHNVIRRRATRDDTWPIKEWLDKMLDVVQNADKKPNVDFIMKEVPNKAGNAMDFSVEIKERISGRTVNYMNPGVLTRVTNDFMSKLAPKEKAREFGRMTVLPTSPKAFLDEVMSINLDAFVRAAKAGSVVKAKALVEKGFLDVHSFEGIADRAILYDDDENEPHPAAQGWNALQLAAYFGRRPMVLYLLDELKMDINSRSVDGWTAMHCACKMGHFEIAKECYERGIGLFDETQEGGGGYTPMTLMLEGKHMGMVRYFIGEDSKFAKDCYKRHGVRPTSMPEDMYLYLKPLPEAIMVEIRKAQKIKADKLAAQKRAEYLAENPDAGRKKDGPKLRGSSKGRSNSKDGRGRSNSSTAKGGKVSGGGGRGGSSTSKKGSPTRKKK